MRSNHFYTFSLICILALFPFTLSAQNAPLTPPKLVVGIVVDQMRADYIQRFWSKFGEGGFKRLYQAGYVCQNTSYNYVPTYTGPGHSSIFSGTTPAIHGICANDWYDRGKGYMVYCASDKSVQTVGSYTDLGQMSPRNLLASNIGDELKLVSQGKSKVIGIALKDRSAIFPAGHAADAAYWYDGKAGNFISSTYYLKELPQWVKDFNNLELPKKLMANPWTTLLPIAQYTESLADDNKYEGLFKGESKATFPHNLPEIAKQSGLGAIAYTPMGASLTRDFALAALMSENLGKDEFPDLLTVSFSSPDYIGHQYGPMSIELEDAYLRLDKDLAELVTGIERTLGTQNVLFFLTADHGGNYVASYLTDNRVPGGLYIDDSLENQLQKHLSRQFGDSLVLEVANQQVYLNYKLIERKAWDAEKIEASAIRFLMTLPHVASAVSAHTFLTTDFTQKPLSLVQRGYFPARSGDIMVQYHPGWMDWGMTGTSHGSPYSYDTQVPLLWYGWKIPAGKSTSPVNITDIAPTLSYFLGISRPNGCTGEIIGMGF